MASPRKRAEARSMEDERFGVRLAQIRQHHGDLQAQLRDSGDALEALERHADDAGIRRLAVRLRLECHEHFPREEALALEVLGARSPSVVRARAEHRQLQERLDRVDAILAAPGSPGAREDLGREVTALLDALSYHLRCEERGLFMLLEFIQLGFVTSFESGRCRH